MSDDIIEYVVSHTGTSRRQFLVRLLAGSAFAAPVIASFAIGGSAAPKRSPLDAAVDLDFGSNCETGFHFDSGSNTCVADDDSSDTGDDDGSEGSGAGIPGTK